MRFSLLKAFTLIELLVVVAIVAIMAVVVVTILNPAQLLAQSRDGRRVSDMSTLYGAVTFYKSDQMGTPSFSLGSSSVIYVSLPDPTASTTAGSNCASLGLPTPPSPYTYHCAGPNYYRNINGTGWIPVSFTSSSVGSPMGSLPVDPTNTSSTRLYYSYTTNGSQFELTSAMESTKYKMGGNSDQVSGDGGTLATVYEKGTKLGLEPLDYGDPSLIGYWPMNEGTGSTTIDYSGSNAVGTWYGAQVGTSGFYSPGKVGAWAGTFDGTSTYVRTLQNISHPATVTSFTYTAWVYATSNVPTSIFADIAGSTLGRIILNNGSCPGKVQGLTACGFTYPLNTWFHVAETWDGTNADLYINGALNATGIYTTPLTGGKSYMFIGAANAAYQTLNGLMDDVRVYNRALSAAEIQAMYNAGK